jgi:hypothetical protein
MVRPAAPFTTAEGDEPGHMMFLRDEFCAPTPWEPQSSLR